MANYFIDSTTGNVANSGLDMDNAWASITDIYTNLGSAISEANFFWVRPNHNEVFTNTYHYVFHNFYGLGMDVWNCIIGWPKPSQSLSQANWTQGSMVVTNIVGVSLSTLSHISRLITGPDGNDYLIEQIPNSSSIYLLEPYRGDTVTGINGACIIKADQYYDEAQAIDDSGWTITKADWNANNPLYPTLDCNFGDTCRILNSSCENTLWQGLYFKNSGYTTLGGFQINSTFNTIIRGIFITIASGNGTALTVQKAMLLIEQCVITGVAGVSRLVGADSYTGWGGGYLTIRDTAIDSGAYGIWNSAYVKLENVNLGMNFGISYEFNNSGFIDGEEIRSLYGFETVPNVTGIGRMATFSIDGYYGSLNESRTIYTYGYFYRESISDLSPYINKKLSDEVICIVQPEKHATIDHRENSPFVLRHQIKVQTGTYTFKYWFFNKSQGVTLNTVTAKDRVWLEASYISQYVNETLYKRSIAYSTQMNIAPASDADDWDYLEVTINVAVESVVKLSLRFFEDIGSGFCAVDPQLVIS